MAVFNGNDFVIKEATTAAGTHEIFAHAQSASISFSNSLIEVTDKDSSSWMTSISGKKSFTISATGLIDYSTISNQNNFEDLFDLAIAGTRLHYTIGNGSDTYEGFGYIDSFEGSGETDGVATYSISITGDGQLEKS